MFHQLQHVFERPFSNHILVFALILFVILVLPVVMRKLKIPGIVGLILAGMAIGPFGFNLVSQNQAIEWFSTIGLLYIMFIAGLELDVRDFRNHRTGSIRFGLLTFGIPFLSGFPLMYFVFGYGMLPSLLVASMLSAHTLVTFPLVQRYRLEKDKAVATTVGGTIFTDTAVLIILALIMNASRSSLDPAFWMLLGLMLLLYYLFVFKLIPIAAAWFFARFEGEKHSHYIFVLAMMFTAAFVAELSGLEPVIGAFVSGLALKRFIPPSSALMNRIEFIGSSLFIPFFLISVGMLVNLSSIWENPVMLAIIAAVTLVAIFTKWLAAMVDQYLGGYSYRQGLLVFGLSSSHAAASVVVILVGYKNGLIDNELLTATVFLVFVSCIVASVITESSVRVLSQALKPTDEIKEKKVYLDEKVLLPIANKANLERLLEFALLIKKKDSPHPISLLTVNTGFQGEKRPEISDELMKAIQKQLSTEDASVVSLSVDDHNVASGIIRVARESVSSVLVLGWPQGSGLIEKLAGSKMDSIVHQFEKTIFIGHFKKAIATHGQIVVAVPPLAELEAGFNEWVCKLFGFAQELSIPVRVFCTKSTEQLMRQTKCSTQQPYRVNYHTFENWEEILVLSKYTGKDDMLVMVSARKGSPSYINELENLPLKIEKYFADYSRLIIFPAQQAITYENVRYKDLDTAPILRGVETLNRLGKEVGGMFKKGE